MVKSKFIFEKRFYHKDSTEEEIQAIKERVFLYDPQIIVLDEIPVVSPYSIGLVFDQIELLGENLGTHGLLIDVSNTERPDAVTRRLINQRFYGLCENATHVAFCSGKNFLINTLLKFVMNQTKLNSFTINTTFEESALAIKKAINNDK